MIHAMIFDLDGTLLDTEWLKCISYTRAVQQLSPRPVLNEDVQHAFVEVLGRSREQVATSLVERFGLKTQLGKDAWKQLADVRLRFYDEILADHDLLRESEWPHNIELLHRAKRAGYKIALATMSYRDQVDRILKALNVQDQFNIVLAREDVERGKPDPEIYLLAVRRLEQHPSDCLVIEDSPIGVQAAVHAGTHCIAVATPLTRAGLVAQKWLAQEWIVYDPAKLPEIFERMIEQQKMTAVRVRFSFHLASIRYKRRSEWDKSL